MVPDNEQNANVEFVRAAGRAFNATRTWELNELVKVTHLSVHFLEVQSKGGDSEMPSEGASKVSPEIHSHWYKYSTKAANNCRLRIVGSMASGDVQSIKSLREENGHRQDCIDPRAKGQQREENNQQETVGSSENKHGVVIPSNAAVARHNEQKAPIRAREKV
ncbi:hypothetical protein BDZ97DRAFT_1754718 [Flammula alnicola]|nr:hypothetical protein BDZ97DRAFT_1754718 [Flammula alnicola]